MGHLRNLLHLLHRGRADLPYDYQHSPYLPFEGDPLDWAVFWERFQSTMDKEVGLSDSDKLTYLRSAMKCKSGEDILNMAIGAGEDYPTIITSLQKAFEQRCMVFREHLQGICRQRFKDASYKELNEGMAKLVKHMHGLVQSGHFSAMYIMTAIMELGLSESLTRHGWSILQMTRMCQPTPC